MKENQLGRVKGESSGAFNNDLNRKHVFEQNFRIFSH